MEQNLKLILKALAAIFCIPTMQFLRKFFKKKLRKSQFEVAASDANPAKMAEQVRKLQQEAKSDFTEQQQQQLGVTPQGEQALIAQINSSWFRYFLAYDPASDLKKLKMHVLALNGILDLQVSYQQNLPVLEKALKTGGNKNYKIQELAGLNHLFQTAKTGNV